MPDEHGSRGNIPWWRSPGAIILWALIAATVAVIFGDPIVENIANLLLEE